MPRNFEPGQLVVAKIQINMLSDLYSSPGAHKVGSFPKGSLLKLGEQHPRGGGKVFFAAVMKNSDEANGERVGVVRVEWVQPVEASTQAGASIGAAMSTDEVLDCRAITLSPVASKTPMVQRTKEDWQFIARQNAFGTTLAQQITDGTAWLPSKGFPANKTIIAKLYDYYGALYGRNPGRFQWAGLARMAGGPFYKGFCDMDDMRAMAQSQLDWNQEHWFVSGVSKAMKSTQPPGAFGASSMEDMEFVDMALVSNLTQALKILMEMGRDIFNDLAWQHEAYQAMGLAELKRFVDLDVLPPGYANAWEKINSSDVEDIWAGNARLLQFEQQDILKRGYEKLQGMLLVPTGMSIMANSPHPWGKSFYEYYGKDIPGMDRYLPPLLIKEVTNYLQRWRWLENNIWPTWKNHSATQRTEFIELPLKNLGERKFVK